MANCEHVGWNRQGDGRPARTSCHPLQIPRRTRTLRPITLLQPSGPAARAQAQRAGGERPGRQPGPTPARRTWPRQLRVRRRRGRSQRRGPAPPRRSQPGGDGAPGCGSQRRRPPCQWRKRRGAARGGRPTPTRSPTRGRSGIDGRVDEGRRRPTARGSARCWPPMPSDQAERRARPLRRRAFKMLRPARVDMRWRKPWFLARRRWLGWKVRFTWGSSCDRSAREPAGGAMGRTVAPTRGRRRALPEKGRGWPPLAAIAAGREGEGQRSKGPERGVPPGPNEPLRQPGRAVLRCPSVATEAAGPHVRYSG